MKFFDRSLWMPRGSVRGLMALGSLVITGWMLIKNVQIPTEWWGLQSAIITFYFVGGVASDTKENMNNGKET